jgi:putative peptidoglycan lipid II flippase
MITEATSEAQPLPPASLARNAGLLSLGNIASRVFGLLREMVIAIYFGPSGEVSAFRVASQVPTILYDFLIGGMLSAALVPVLSDYARRERHLFAYLVGVLLSVFALVLAVVALALAWMAPLLAGLLAGGFRAEHPELLQLTTILIRSLAPVVWVFGMAGVITAVLYARQRFTAPAVATTLFNLGIVVVTPLLAWRFGVFCLVLGIGVGSLAQLLLLIWDLRRADIPWRFQVNWRHPALRKIIQLYAPIAAGLVISLVQVGLDRRLATGTGEQSVAWMANATTLQQLPLGLISVAISLAALPRLSQYFAAGQEVEFRRTLGRGLRMVLLLMAPAAVTLWLLGAPITRLIFEHGEFKPADTLAVGRALNIYVLGMLFAAVDFPLNYAFYARNNTLLPALVGVFSVLVYTMTAFALVQPAGYLGLVWADTAKQASHVLVMLMLLAWRIRRLNTQFRRGGLQIGVAALAMGATGLLVQTVVAGRLPGGWPGDLLQLALVGGAGLLVYGGVLHLWGVDELRLIGSWLRRRAATR